MLVSWAMKSEQERKVSFPVWSINGQYLVLLSWSGCYVDMFIYISSLCSSTEKRNGTKRKWSIFSFLYVLLQKLFLERVARGGSLPWITIWKSLVAVGQRSFQERLTPIPVVCIILISHQWGLLGSHIAGILVWYLTQVWKWKNHCTGGSLARRHKRSSWGNMRRHTDLFSNKRILIMFAWCYFRIAMDSDCYMFPIVFFFFF